MTNKVGRLALIGQSLDAMTFAVAVTLLPGLIAFERNPVIGTLFAVGGLALVVGLKVGLASVCYWKAPVHDWVRALVAIAAVSGFVGAAANTYSMWRVLYG